MSDKKKSKDGKTKEIPESELKKGIKKIIDDANESDTKITKGEIRSRLEVALGKTDCAQSFF